MENTRLPPIVALSELAGLERDAAAIFEIVKRRLRQERSHVRTVSKITFDFYFRRKKVGNTLSYVLETKDEKEYELEVPDGFSYEDTFGYIAHRIQQLLLALDWCSTQTIQIPKVEKPEEPKNRRKHDCLRIITHNLHLNWSPMKIMTTIDLIAATAINRFKQSSEGQRGDCFSILLVEPPPSNSRIQLLEAYAEVEVSYQDEAGGTSNIERHKLELDIPTTKDDLHHLLYLIGTRIADHLARRHPKKHTHFRVITKPEMKNVVGAIAFDTHRNNPNRQH